MEKIDPRELSAPALMLYMYIATIFEDILLKNPWPINAKFYVEPPWEGGTKVYINGPGHMTKMAVMPIYGKKIQKSSSPEPEVL